MSPKSDQRSSLINIDGGSASDQRPLDQAEPIYDVFLGGSCGNTCWRRDIVIPYLKKRDISYYDPQRPVWSENMIQEEQRAKENSRIFLFVLDPGTINATSFLEIAYLAARKASKLVVVFLGKHEWSDKALRVDLPDRIRTCNLLEAILQRHSVLMLTSISQALDFVDAKIIGGKRWLHALRTPAHRLPFIKLQAQQCATRCSERWHSVAHLCRLRLLTHFKRFALLLLFEAFLVMSFAFLLSINTLPLAVPLWAIVLPLLALNYLLLLGMIIYCRFKSHKRKRKALQQRALHLPVLPLPRVHTLPDNLATAAVDVSATATSSERRPRRFFHRGKVSSGSGGGPCSSYGPMIELLISGSTSGSAATTAVTGNNKSKQYTNNSWTMIKPDEKRIDRRASDRTSTRPNGCCLTTTPIGYDVFLSCSSSSELDWITQKAVPELHKNGLSYTSSLMCHSEMRIPFLHTASHILYYIPSYKTFLSGMIEIAYFIGHADWQVTVCVPREAECLVMFEAAERVDPEIRRAVERRNECYRVAFSYLKDMATRRQVRVFTRVDDAIRHIRDTTPRPQEHDGHQNANNSANLNYGTNTDQSFADQFNHDEKPLPNQKRTALRQILEKQHLVKERTSTNLLAHLREAAARGQRLELDLAEIRPDGCISMSIDLNQLRPLAN
ncbi:hypothetical protein niasHS_004858 [Heterodera schachtii]|uniref:Uncharacterized protein n=1 Tax=Heterodera schachtii TaxID=97005 RepID=A0ABD2JLI1_HETSC